MADDRLALVHGYDVTFRQRLVVDQNPGFQRREIGEAAARTGGKRDSKEEAGRGSGYDEVARAASPDFKAIIRNVKGELAPFPLNAQNWADGGVGEKWDPCEEG